MRKSGYFGTAGAEFWKGYCNEIVHHQAAHVRDGYRGCCAAALNLTAGEIVNALRAQNVQVAAGTLGQPPYATGNAFQVNVETQGRLTDPQQFANIVIRS